MPIESFFLGVNMKDKKEYMRNYYQKNKDKRKEYLKAWREAHKEKIKAYNKANKAYWKAWNEANKEKRNEYMKEYTKADVNSFGETKKIIRQKSWCILKQMNLHIEGYEIHHCFTYDDPAKFIYISRSLHLKIHQFLRDNNIDADSDHWMQIRDLVNSTDEFMYIKC